MRKKIIAATHLFVALCLIGWLGSAGEAQKRGSNSRNNRAASSASTARSEAAKFWARYVPVCNGSRYLKKAASIFVELRGFRLSTDSEPLSEADRLNGIEAKGYSKYSATSSRIYADGRWGNWQSGLPEDSKLTSSVRFQKSGGVWRFYGIGYFNDYAQPMTCSDLPGATVSRRDEVPTNAIQIDSTHVFPIRYFWLWDGGTNKPGPRFPQSTTTYIFWKIMYQETAFDYRPPPTESYWFKDGKQWSYAESAGFSNRGAGQLFHGKGYDEPGHWEPGNYTIKIYVGKKLVKVAEFEIYADGDSPGDLRFDGIYRFDNPAGNGFVNVVRFHRDGTIIFGRTLAANRPLATPERMAACLLPGKQKSAGCAEFEIVQGKYTVRDRRIEFVVQFPGESISYEGTTDANALDLQSAEGISLNKSDERFVFLEIR